jgi:hypothetical protein
MLGYSYNSDDNEDDIEYGFHITKCSTSYKYCDSSSLNPAQIMEQEVYYENAEISMNLSLQNIQIISIFLPLFNQYNAVLHHWLQLQTLIEHALSSLLSIVPSIKNHIVKLTLFLQWTNSYVEMALLYAEDISVFIRCHNCIKLNQFFWLDKINWNDCHSWFWHITNDLRCLFIAWRIPVWGEILGTCIDV